MVAGPQSSPITGWGVTLLDWFQRLTSRQRVSVYGRCEFINITWDEKAKRARTPEPCGGALKPFTTWLAGERVKALRCQACGREAAVRA